MKIMMKQLQHGRAKNAARHCGTINANTAEQNTEEKMKRRRKVLDVGETMAAVPDRDTLTEILKRRRRFQRAFRRQYWFTEPRRRRQMRRLVAHYERKGLERVADGFVDEALLPPF